MSVPGFERLDLLHAIMEPELVDTARPLESNVFEFLHSMSGHATRWFADAQLPVVPTLMVDKVSEHGVTSRHLQMPVQMIVLPQLVQAFLPCVPALRAIDGPFETNIVELPCSLVGHAVRRLSFAQQFIV